MFNLLGNIPKDPFYVAVSGGKDSMVFLDFLMKYPKNRFELLYFNHGTVHGQEAENFLIQFCKENELVLHIGKVSREKEKGESPEEFWRKERYAFFERFDKTIITCHHLADSLETWIFTSLRGNPKLIPYMRGKFLRPFLMVPKNEIEKWTVKYSVKHVEDPSNKSLKYSRNKIRHQLIPIALSINPGLDKTIKKLIVKEFMEKYDGDVDSDENICYN